MARSDARSRAKALAEALMASSDDLVVRVRELRSLLERLDVDLAGSDALATLVAVDSEADAWPVGVDAARLDPEHRRRCEDEMRAYGERVWPAVREGCRALLAHLSQDDPTPGPA